MLTIRLARTGRNKYPTYRIVAAESARAVTGKFVEVLGNYNPHTKELTMNKDEIERYIKNGAQPSNAVAKLLKKEKVKLPDWVEIKTKNRAPKNDKSEESAGPVESENQKSEANSDGADNSDNADAAEAPETTEVAEVAAEHSEEVAEEAAAAPAEADAEASEITETAATDEAEAEASKAASDAAADAAGASAPSESPKA